MGTGEANYFTAAAFRFKATPGADYISRAEQVKLEGEVVVFGMFLPGVEHGFSL